MDAILPLVGVVVGGVLTMLTTRWEMRRRYERESDQAREEQRRDGLGDALDWLDLVSKACLLTRLMTHQLKTGQITEQQFQADMPEGLEIALKAPPTRVRALWPADAHARILELIEALDAIRLGVPVSSEGEVMEECRQLSSRLAKLQVELTTQFRSTFMTR